MLEKRRKGEKEKRIPKTQIEVGLKLILIKDIKNVLNLIWMNFDSNLLFNNKRIYRGIVLST